MKALVYNKKKKPQQQLVEIPKPTITPNEVLIKVVSTSINAADYRSLKMGIVPKKKIFGSAVSGVIEEVGSEVKNLKPKDEIIADTSNSGFGGLAEFIALPKDVVISKPNQISFSDAATIPVAGTTAIKALRSIQNKSDQKVLIVGSSGGVGTFAVQIAKHYGAAITCVCSSRNTDQAKKLGADAIINYTSTDFTKTEQRFDLILAINGNYPLAAYKKLLKPKGTCIVIGGSLSQIFKTMFLGWAYSLGSKKIKVLKAKADPKDLIDVAELMNEGKIKAVIEQTYTLNNATEAFDTISQGHAKGKFIITI